MEIKVVKQILEWNEDVSSQVREKLAEKKVKLINVMGSPGAGKTSLLVQVIEALRDKYRIGVIEGDIGGQIDAETISAMGIPAVQLHTGGACHIEAMSIQHMLPMFDLDNLDLLFVENIGNLVCPAEFDIGENFRIAILSVPEGDDKVIKYPLMFQETDCLVINKYDMQPYFDFNTEKVAEDAKNLNGHVEIFCLSSKTGEGFAPFLDWLEAKITEE